LKPLDYSREVLDYRLKALDYSPRPLDYSLEMVDYSRKVIQYSPAGTDLNRNKEAFMAHSDWVPTREQDLVDLAQKWAVVLADSVKITAFGWDSAECTALSPAGPAPTTSKSTVRMISVYQTGRSCKKCQSPFWGFR
ncbi:MAG: hypothetical protein LBF83_02175, partial [Spirochaetaceae bacterium]|nr:hypothetical protein [Spirochaetaceae bacterium]